MKIRWRSDHFKEGEVGLEWAKSVYLTAVAARLIQTPKLPQLPKI